MSNDNDRAATPSYGVTQFNGEIATAIEFERFDDGVEDRFNASFKLDGEEVMRLDGLRFDDMRDAVGERNVSKMIEGPRTGTLSGTQLENFASEGFTSAGVTRNTVEHDVEAERSAEPKAERAAPEAPAVASAEAERERTDDEDERRAEILRQVGAQFVVKGKAYHFKQQGEPVAFVDKGAKLVSSSNDERAAKAMATVAEGRGWESIKVTGHPTFRKAVWLEASARGLAVRGYTATADDRTALASRTGKQTAENTVERIEAREKPTERVQASKDAPDTATPAAPKNASTDKPRTHSGVLAAHGVAPYKHDPKAKGSYYATLKDERGQERTVWGKDIQRAIEASGLDVGSRVSLVNTGNKPVTVTEEVKDKDGRVTGTKEVTAHLNRWEVHGNSRAQVVAAVSTKLIDEQTNDPEMQRALKDAMQAELARRERAGTTPGVRMYDQQAPARTADQHRNKEADKTIERSR